PVERKRPCQRYGERKPQHRQRNRGKRFQRPSFVAKRSAGDTVPSSCPLRHRQPPATRLARTAGATFRRKPTRATFHQRRQQPDRRAQQPVGGQSLMIADLLASPNDQAKRLIGRDYLSWSSISCWMTCPLKFWFRYVQQAPEESVTAS